MELTSFAEARNSREKLQRMEQLHAEQSLAPSENEYARELSLRSLRDIINQLKEEVTRFEVRASLLRPEDEVPTSDVPVRSIESG